jgi:preprotein translocase subunit SecY
VAHRNDALVGDLFEEYGRRQSAAWYWRQVLTAVLVGLSKEALLVFGIAALLLAGAFIPVPGVHAGLVALASRPAMGNRTWSLLPMIPGWQLSGITIFALGITPYVSAVFIVQLVVFLWSRVRPHTAARLPIVMLTRCAAIALSVIQAVAVMRFLERANLVGGEPPLVDNPGWTFRLTAALAITFGTACLMFIADEITRRRMGNGMLLVFVAALLAALPASLWPVLSGMMDPVPILGGLMMQAITVGIASYLYRRAVERELST